MPETRLSEEAANGKEKLVTKIRVIVARTIRSRSAGWLANLPPVAWVIRSISRRFLKGQIGEISGLATSTERPVGVDLQITLEGIVFDVVQTLDYIGAMVATYEQGDSMPVRAFYINPEIASLDQIRQWEAQVSEFDPEHPVTISDPNSPYIGRVLVNDEHYKDNLGVKASRDGEIKISRNLFDLFTPIAPLASKPIIAQIQKTIEIEEVIAVPFFLGKEGEKELVGNLFAAKQGKIEQQDQLILAAFGRQAAAAIGSERRRIQALIAQELVFQIQKNLENENEILRQIAKGVVARLKYVGVMVAVYEPENDSLPVRAFYIDPAIASMEQVRQWERRVSEFDPEHPVTISDPESPNVGRTYINDEHYKDNLSVKAARKGGLSFSKELYELFTPIAPLASKAIVEEIQKELGIKKVIAVPFFLDGDFIGNLFAASKSEDFSGGEIELLRGFAQQAAAGIRNARLYRQAEDRLEMLESFGRMAFSASALVHNFGNHIAVVRGNLQMIKYLEGFSEDDRRKFVEEDLPKVLDRLDKVADILKGLRDPWHQVEDVPTEIKSCMEIAKGKVKGMYATTEIEIKLEQDLPRINTSPEMLTEVFRIFIKNGVEAVEETDRQKGLVRVKAALHDPSTIEVQIQDNGTGIKRENLGKIFTKDWTTKSEAGLGIGLAWSREYVQSLQGEIKVESKWQEGTTFSILFPIAAE